MAELLKDVELSKKGASGTDKGGNVLKGKLVGLYFSAHWCWPCCEFTPHLRAFYEERRAAGEQFEIVFASWDKTPDEMAKYLAEAHGDWYYLPHGSGWIKKLEVKYSVKGIPTLLVVDADGEVISKDGVGEVTPPLAAFKQWKEQAAWMENEKTKKAEGESGSGAKEDDKVGKKAKK